MNPSTIYIGLVWFVLLFLFAKIDYFIFLIGINLTIFGWTKLKPTLSHFVIIYMYMLWDSVLRTPNGQLAWVSGLYPVWGLVRLS